MTGSANDATLGRHLESLASAMKRYTLAELLQVTQAVAADLENISVSGGASYTDFTGAGLSTAGLSGLVPAPHAGDQNKFLRGDGSWATVSSGGSSAVSGGNVLSTVASTVDGGFWYELSDDVPVLKLRHGDYEYSFGYDAVSYKGDNSYLVSYLPLDSSTTADACGNSWSVTGTASLDSVVKKFGVSSLCLPASNSGSFSNKISASGIFNFTGEKWTVDAWILLPSLDYSWEIISFGTGDFTGVAFCPQSIVLGLGMSPKSFKFTAVANTWMHLAVVKDGSTYYVFKNGSLFGTSTDEVTYAGTTIRISGHRYTGVYVDEFRVHNGVALWTSDFTVPTAADYA